MVRKERPLPEERLAQTRSGRRIGFWVGAVGAFCGISGITVVGLFHEPAKDAPAVNVTSEDYAGGWGPDRPTFTIDVPSTYAVFNSITDNPNYGDERNFVTVKPSSAVGPGGWVDELEVLPGDRVVLRAYVENSAADNFESSPTSWLQGSTVSAGLNDDKAYVAHAWMRLSAENAVAVWDGVTIRGPEAFTVRVIDGSALQISNIHPEGVALSEGSIFGQDGASIGSEGLDGVIRPGYQYSLLIIVELEVVGL